MRNNLSTTPPIQCDRGCTHKGREQPTISTPLLLLYATIAILLVVLIKTTQSIAQLFHFLLSLCFTNTLAVFHCIDTTTTKPIH